MRKRSKKIIRVSAVAQDWGVAPKTIVQWWRDRGWAITRFTHGRTSPNYIYQADVETYKQEVGL